MPTFEFDDKAAVANFATNIHSRWYYNDIDVNDSSGNFAVQRLTSDLFTPSVPPSDLVIRSDDRLFAIGSCFARGIEKAMLSRGFEVPSMAKEFDGFELRFANTTGRGFTNKYTTFAIRNEVQWALDPDATFPLETLVEEDGVWIDPHVTPTLKWIDWEGTLGRREVIRTVYGRLATSRIVVMTLGLVETWLDTQTGVRLNMTPVGSMRSQWPGRYLFQVTSFSENRAAVEDTWDTLRRYGHPDVQIVVTVSPVPLNATFSDRDVVVANAYSKSVLRAVAEDWAASHPNVHYFPSYEIVTNSARGLAWEADGRHVRGEVVHHIMDLFQRSFVPSANT